jgi:iron complex outermembrane receptor protein
VLFKSRWMIALFLLCSVGRAAGAEPSGTASSQDDILEFFEEEAQVITASRQPRPLHQSPATVYVLTREEIVASGAQTLWEALRPLPGLDVMHSETFQGEVSIRGLNKTLNNRTLVLLDGKPVLNGYYDKVAWESIPIGVEEIDRIEVVEGPVSALYGANAVNGVINIISRTPGQLAGGVVRLTAGQRDTYLGNALYGMRRGNLDGKISLGRRTTNRFESPDQRASAVHKMHAYLGYRLSTEQQIEVRGGVTHIDSRLNLGGLGTVKEIGPSGYARADYRRGNTGLRAYWDRNRTHLSEEENLPDEPGLNYDTFSLAVEHSPSLPQRHTLTAGGHYRWDRMRSALLFPGTVRRNLSSLFFEYQWQPRRALTLVSSGRFDRHSLTGWEFAPRGSVIFAATERHLLRFSAAIAFRFPTLMENELQLDRSIAIEETEPLVIDTLGVMLQGNRKLEAERLRMLELAYRAQLGRVHLAATGFRYWLTEVIASTVPQFEPMPSGLHITSSFENLPGDTRAWGGELEARVKVTRQWSSFANYSYQKFDGILDPQTSANGGPRHKVNAGGRFVTGGFSLAAGAHWVGSTTWFRNALFSTSTPLGAVDSYISFDGRIAYAFDRGRLRNLTLSLNAFNLADREHFETLPSTGGLSPGQSGEIIRRRLTTTVSYPF